MPASGQQRLRQTHRGRLLGKTWWSMETSLPIAQNSEPSGTSRVTWLLAMQALHLPTVNRSCLPKAAAPSIKMSSGQYRQKVLLNLRFAQTIQQSPLEVSLWKSSIRSETSRS